MPCLMLDVRGVLLRRPGVVSPQASEMSMHRLSGLAMRWEWATASEVREGGLGPAKTGGTVSQAEEQQVQRLQSIRSVVVWG